MITPDIQVLEDPLPAFTQAILDTARSRGHIVLTGGSTPRLAYERAAQQPEAFAGAHIWFGDERCVPPEDERSNFGMARQALLDPLDQAGVQLGSTHRMKGELGHRGGAGDYARQLRDASNPEFDLILLGIGPDAHIASMFPGQLSLAEQDALVVGVPEAGHEPYVPRISFTFPALARARQVLLLATGEGKADAVAKAFGSEASPTTDAPASMLAQHVRALTVLLDRDAAGGL
ncbi:MAG TPA: 6-phosphogluconolactonase [Solirubrobacteraceae bacterium]|nr:6-phosphogluconolactonase [Solirubrobacteraceae bacterium]